MAHASLASASGLRPMSAFVVVGAVVLLVAGWVLRFSLSSAAQPGRLRVEEGERPAYSIADSKGRTLARFVPRFDLEMSPRSMWQAHTPQRMAATISGILGGSPTEDELLAAMLPDARDGVIRAEGLALDARAAHRIGEWIASGAGTEKGPLEGIWLEDRGDMTFRLVWQPEIVLGEALRERCGSKSAWRWARRIADGLARALHEPTLEQPLLGSAVAQRGRDEIWKALLPSAFCRPIVGVAPERVLALREELERQGVAAWQMKIAYARDRAYPSGEHELFGSWGFARPDQLERRPREGLELVCDRLLAGETELGLEFKPEVYTWLDDRTVRGERAPGYVSFAAASQPPVLVSTLDIALQRYVGQVLKQTLDEHQAALAMALVIDVESGDVLAVDSQERYPIQPFAPIYHVFTTGSTFKVVTMAVALEEGVVEPTTRFEVGEGEYRVHYPDGRPSARVIHEAEGALTGTHSAAELFAFSVNAGLAQIGLRVEDAHFRKYLCDLGYGKPAGSALGIERAGNLTPLPWKYAYTHASVGFGHEISTTAWQHAAALATVIRGGVFRPLRILRAIEQVERRIELPLDEGTRIFSQGTCDKVREMMRLGAEVGTGREVRATFEQHLAQSLQREIQPSEVDLGTKTGTAEKVPSELCVHVELAERARWERDGLAPTKARVEALRRLAKPHGRCYTSSIVVFGRAPGGERELMVFVVVEEPRGKERFGSRVAGPAAEAILIEGLGLTRQGAVPSPDLVEGFGESVLPPPHVALEPWRDGG